MRRNKRRGQFHKIFSWGFILPVLAFCLKAFFNKGLLIWNLLSLLVLHTSTMFVSQVISIWPMDHVFIGLAQYYTFSYESIDYGCCFEWSQQINIFISVSLQIIGALPFNLIRVELSFRFSWQNRAPLHPPSVLPGHARIIYLCLHFCNGFSAYIGCPNHFFLQSSGLG